MAIKKEALEIRLFSWYDDRYYRIRYTNEAKQEVEEFFPSVTTKLGALDEPFLRRWYGQVGLEEALRVLREAGDRGSRIHWAWQVYCLGGAIIYDPDHHAPYTPEEIAEIKDRHTGNWYIIRNQDEMLQLSKLQAWHQEIKPKEIKSEQIVYNIEEKDAGTLDNLVCIDEGSYAIAGSKPLKLSAGWYVVDIKTGSTVSDKARMQVARYAYMVEKLEKDIRIQGGLIVHTSSTTKTGIEGLTTIHMDRDELKERNMDYLDIAKVWNRQCKNAKPTIRQLPALITRG